MSNRYGYIGTAGPTQATQGKNKAYNPIKYQINIDYLVVAGGGSGGDGTAAGGGGAGGVRSTMGATGGGCGVEYVKITEGMSFIQRVLSVNPPTVTLHKLNLFGLIFASK